MDREQLFRYILDMEWEMFTNVHNKDGKASCQNDHETFVIMRLAQLKTWDEEILASYFLDLLEAKEAGRNLMTEKYAYMMEKTYPDEFMKLKDSLPVVSDAAKVFARAILKIYVVWEDEMERKYPKIRKRGRRSNTEAVSDGNVTMEDYHYCELITYSERTLQLLLEYIGQNAKRNLYMEEVANMVQAYGYKDLDAAEAAL